jgi:crotonobetainyl-CoA:carnitine CoA-transferase CaiB-like acyl-CoA transferase
VSGPLDGLRVVEFCDELGQLAGKLLADMGADVVKVEPPAGSSARAIGPFVKDVPGPNRSLNFWYHNTNKRSVILDIEGSGPARKLAARLIDRADIVLEDHEPGWMSLRGLSNGEALKRNAELIWCSITPFGQDGPWAKYRVTDLVALAAGGPMTMNGYDAEDAPGAPPIRGHGDQAYNTACHFAVQGVLAALLWRDHSGLGQHIDCSMHEALSCTTEVGMPYWLYQRRDVIRQTSRHAAAQRTEPWLHGATDGRYNLIFGVARDNATWTRLKKWFQREGYGLQFDEPRFDSPAARQPGRGSPDAAEVMDEVGRFIAGHTADEVYRGGQEIGNAWGIVRSPDETLADPHLHDRGFFVGVTGDGVDSPALMPGAPYLFSATPWELRRPAPRLGEHTSEVIAELDWLSTR